MPGISRIYFVGFMGCGKTTAGRKLASALGWSFTDLDKLIENYHNKTIAEIFSEHGEPYFRRIEYDALHTLLPPCDSVVSVGGGAPCYSDNMDYMKNTGLVIYLNMTPAGLKQRLDGRQKTRPLLNNLSGDDLLMFIEKKLEERNPFYRRAHIIIDGSDPDISDLVKLIKRRSVV